VGKYGQNYGPHYQRTTFNPGAGLSHGEAYIFNKGTKRQKVKVQVVTFVSSPLTDRIETRISSGIVRFIETAITSKLGTIRESFIGSGIRSVKESTISAGIVGKKIESYVSSGLKVVENTYVKARVMKDDIALLSKQERIKALREIYFLYKLKKFYYKRGRE